MPSPKPPQIPPDQSRFLSAHHGDRAEDVHPPRPPPAPARRPARPRPPRPRPLNDPRPPPPTLMRPLFFCLSFSPSSPGSQLQLRPAGPYRGALPERRQVPPLRRGGAHLEVVRDGGADVSRFVPFLIPDCTHALATAAARRTTSRRSAPSRGRIRPRSVTTTARGRTSSWTAPSSEHPSGVLRPLAAPLDADGPSASPLIARPGLFHSSPHSQSRHSLPDVRLPIYCCRWSCRQSSKALIADGFILVEHISCTYSAPRSPSSPSGASHPFNPRDLSDAPLAEH
ncbi:hypothetical protein B0H17DRAFT_1326794 [Mycena rosella]|uniref:Uncharacterized protein n=1 Tax=Mycena rosella TaxID=1033263 RepID=A0AAD7GP02_MYCRO|nr:hypothetical protein B0H17DRAFT_1326794 [Mycena rosella]